VINNKKHTIKINVLFCAFIIFTMSSNSQTINIINSSTSVAHTGTSDIGEWTTLNNPAALAYVKTFQIGLLYDNRFGMSQLATKAIQIAYPSKGFNCATSISHYGYSLYNELNCGLILARNFGDKFAIGIQSNYYATYFSNLNRYLGTLIVQFGVNTQISPNLSMAFHAFNPMQLDIKTDNSQKYVISLFSFGSNYSFTPQCSWRAQIDKQLHFPYRIATAIDYRVVEPLKIKVGAYYSQFFVPCLGLALYQHGFVLHLNSEVHPFLGITNCFALKYNFNNTSLTTKSINEE